MAGACGEAKLLTVQALAGDMAELATAFQKDIWIILLFWCLLETDLASVSEKS